MASKPDKYGQKYWLAVGKDSMYVVNGFPYVGRDDNRSKDDRVSDQVVMRLLKPYLNKGRNVTTDNYFTSIKLATELQKYKTSLLKTVNRIRKEVSAVVKHMKKPHYFTAPYKSGDATMTVYQAKTKKNVAIFSTFHQNITIAGNAKKTPENVKACNDAKYGVDIVNQLASKYMVRTSNRRWPIHLFQNTLDLAAINASIVYKEVMKNNISKRIFLQQLAQDLSGPYLDKRSNTKKRRSQEETFDEEHSKMAKYCQVNSDCKKNHTVGTCLECSESLCGKCTAKTVRLCVKCSSSQQ